MPDPKDSSEDKPNSPAPTPGTAEGEKNPASGGSPRVGRTPGQAEGERDSDDQAGKNQKPNTRK